MRCNRLPPKPSARCLGEHMVKGRAHNRCPVRTTGTCVLAIETPRETEHARARCYKGLLRQRISVAIDHSSLLYRDRDFSVRTKLSSSHKKKKRPPGFGASQLGIRAWVYEYLGPDGHAIHLIPASQLGIRA